MRAQPKLQTNCVIQRESRRDIARNVVGEVNLMQVLDNATTDGNALEYVKLSKIGEVEDDEEHQVSPVSKMPGDEWKKLSDQVKEPHRKEYEAAKAQFDRDANGGTNEKGIAALRKETLQLKESKKASKDKDALLAETREEIKKSLSADHKITDVIKKAGERWKSLPADEKQKMDAVGISRTSSSTFNSMMMQSRTKHAIWRDISDRRTAEKTRSAIPSLCARPARELNAIVFSAGTFSNRNEVKDTSPYVV